jgi:hypothetical protein
MIIQYFFSFDDGLDLSYDVQVNRRFSIHADYSHAPEWTKLTNNQCKNCPLDKKSIAIVLRP